MMSRKAIAGEKVAKKKGEPAVKFGAGIDGRKTGLGSGLLSEGVKKFTKARTKRQQAIDDIMKDL